MRFEATIVQIKTSAGVELPEDPAKVWGDRDQYHVSGTFNGDKVRGPLKRVGDRWYMPIGSVWLQDSSAKIGDSVNVELDLEGPRVGNMGDDVDEALEREPVARKFFESLPTFYRNNYNRWIQSAKRPETRARRIAEMLQLLKDNRRER